MLSDVSHCLLYIQQMVLIQCISWNERGHVDAIIFLQGFDHIMPHIIVIGAQRQQALMQAVGYFAQQRQVRKLADAAIRRRKIGT